MLIVIIVIVVVVVAVIGGYYYLSLDTEENGNGNGNGNGSNRAPHAEFDYFPKPVIVNQTVHFDSSNSTDPDGDDLTYEWNFGDPYSEPGNPNTADDANPEHIYRNPGSYDVNLIVDDGRGKNDTYEVTITVEEDTTPEVELSVTRTQDPVHASTNIRWRINIDSVTMTEQQNVLDNIEYMIYGTDENDVKDSGNVGQLDPPTPIPPNTKVDNGVYFTSADNRLTEDDWFSIAEDGGGGIVAGDTFRLIYVSRDIVMGEIQLT